MIKGKMHLEKGVPLYLMYTIITADLIAQGTTLQLDVQKFIFG